MMKINKSLSSRSLHSSEVVEGKTDINHSNPFLRTLMQGSDKWMMWGGLKSEKGCNTAIIKRTALQRV